jgi:hypothetical protein
VTHQLVFIGLMVACCGYALAMGGAPERTAVGIVAAGIIVSIVTMPAHGHAFRRLEVDELLIDGGMWLAFQALAIFADRFWTTWVAGLQLATIFVHVAAAVTPSLVPFTYSASLWIFEYGIILLIGVGTFRHRARRRVFGFDSGWSS